MTPRARTATLLGVAAFVLAACCLTASCALAKNAVAYDGTPVTEATRDTAPQAVALLTIDNRSLYDADVYLLHDGQVVEKVGQASGFSQTHYALRGASIAGLGATIALYAKSWPDGTVYRSDAIQMRPGIHLVWTLGPLRGADALFIQNAQ